MTSEDLAYRIMDIDNEVTQNMGIFSRPSGPERADYIREMCIALESAGIEPYAIDPVVRDTLEAENFHSATAALSVYCGERTIDEILEDERQYYGHLF